jgi:hypothetical protein
MSITILPNELFNEILLFILNGNQFENDDYEEI